MKDLINVVVKLPGRRPEPRQIPNTLEELQGFVGGYIETVTLASDCVIICNEEGRINGMKYNCTICGVQLFGPILLCGVDGEEFSDLPYGLDVLKTVLSKSFSGEGRDD